MSDEATSDAMRTLCSLAAEQIEDLTGKIAEISESVGSLQQVAPGALQAEFFDGLDLVMRKIELAAAGLSRESTRLRRQLQAARFQKP